MPSRSPSRPTPTVKPKLKTFPITEDSDSHLLVEDATGAEQAFEIVKDTVTTMDVCVDSSRRRLVMAHSISRNSTAQESPKPGGVTTGNPGDGAANTPQYCGSGFASFLIYAFSDESGIPISIDVDGFNSIDLPPTDGSPHLILEVDGNGNEIASANFNIE